MTNTDYVSLCKTFGQFPFDVFASEKINDVYSLTVMRLFSQIETGKFSFMKSSGKPSL